LTDHLLSEVNIITLLCTQAIVASTPWINSNLFAFGNLCRFDFVVNMCAGHSAASRPNMFNLPVYLNCYFFPGKGDKIIFKIDESTLHAHPYQLFKSNNEGLGDWENLSVYESVDDAVMTLLKDLVTEELADEIVHGQATLNPDDLMERINRGDRSVSILGRPESDSLREDSDIDFGDLIERK
jgi:hypothetical protein